MKRNTKPEEPENPFWITYSDLLSSMVLLLLILLVIFIKISEAQRRRLQMQFERMQNTVVQNKKLLALAPELQKKSASLLQLKKELRALKRLLLSERNLEIELQDNDLTLSVDQRLLFDGNSVDLKPDGKVFLAKFVPPLAKTITKPEYHELITGIAFEGRADPSFNGSDWNDAYLHNLELTLDRSQNVVSYVFGGDFKVVFAKDKEFWPGTSRERFRYLVLSSGRSSVDRVKKEVPNPDHLREEWVGRKLSKLKDPRSRQVVIRLELFNPLKEFDFESTQ